LFFPFAPFPACFVLHLSDSGQNKPERSKGSERRPEGGWQGASGGAVRDKPLMVYGLARHRRISPSDRPSRGQAGVHPEEGGVGAQRLARPTVVERQF
jgi:hypothetical protein